MTRTRTVTLFTSIALGLVGCMGNPDARTDALVIDAETDTEFSGTYAEAGWLVFFESAQLDADHATMHLDVNGVIFDATVDRQTRAAWWTGHDGALYAEDLAALDGLLEALGEHMNGREMRSHERFLVSRVGFWAEAPAGITMAERDVDFSVTRSADEPRLPPENAFIADEHSGDVGPTPGTAEAAAVNYQATGEDGAWAMACNTNNWAVHDAVAHCTKWESIYSGPAATECQGACGGGCPWWDDTYTYDCHDHDQCANRHGGSTDPWDDHCGDEYWEADDDYFSYLDNCD